MVPCQGRDVRGSCLTPRRSSPSTRRRVSPAAVSRVLLLTALLPFAVAHSGDAEMACDALLDGDTLVWRIDELRAVREATRQGDRRFQAALSELQTDADEALERGPYSVAHKSQDPPSGDRRDYMSMAPYWWPPEGGGKSAPYERRDGKVNPERDGNGYDRSRLRAFIDDVSTLSLAAFFTGDSRYARHAERLVRVWFVDPHTRMNPHLRYAQGVPGRSTGRSFGIIDTRRLIEVVDAVELLYREDAIRPDVAGGVRTWFSEYTQWLITDPMALTEREARNNHGTYYDAQLMSYALFARNCALARRVVQDTRYRIARHIAADGTMPEELSRTRSLHYHVFNLHAFLHVARLAEHVGEDLYTFRTEDGVSMLSSLSLLAAYAGRESQWPYPQLEDNSAAHLWRMLRVAGSALSDEALHAAIARASGRREADRILLTTGSIELSEPLAGN